MLKPIALAGTVSVAHLHLLCEKPNSLHGVKQPRVNFFFCFVPLSGGGVSPSTLVLWAEGPADIPSIGASLSLHHPPG